MADAPERIRVAQDADGFWTCREAVSGSQEYVRADLYAALEAQLAEVRTKLQERADWHKCSCPHPCDDYNVFPGGCAGKYRQDYMSILSALEAAAPEGSLGGVDLCRPPQRQRGSSDRAAMRASPLPASDQPGDQVMDMTADKATDDVRGLVTKLQTLAEDDTSHYPATAKKLAAEAAATLTSLLERAERAEARIKELEQDLALLCGRVGDDDGQPSEQQEWHDFDPDC